MVIGDAFTDITVPQHLVTKEFFELVRSRLTDDGVYLMNVIDHADQLQALASIAATLQSVFPEVEIWVQNTGQPLEGRLVFILARRKFPPPRHPGWTDLTRSHTWPGGLHRIR